MNTFQDPLSRRNLLNLAGAGFGAIAASHLLQHEAFSANKIAAQPRQPHHKAKARSIIWLFMNGGQSQVDTWDHKPELIRRNGQTLEGFDPKTGFFPGSVGPLMASPFEWNQHGQSGSWASSLFPHLSKHVDRMAFIH